tara:strand:- start:1475 stop:2377 length:903 start_codon:yes stop_codon:yes gene_type:complete
MGNKTWWKLSREVDRNLEDLIIWNLTEMGIISYAFNYSLDYKNIIQVNIWLPKSNWDKHKLDQFEKKFSEFTYQSRFVSKRFIYESIKEEDWLNGWKKYWKPECIGKNFLVLPCWMNLTNEYDNKNVIRIDPGLAFGTGSHPSTALCLEMMEKFFLKDRKILDIGCGSGILSIAAKKLGAKDIYAMDNDYLAINSVNENFVINFPQIKNLYVKEGSFPLIAANYYSADFDFIFCNIRSIVMKEIIPHLSKCIKLNGIVLLSGILDSQKEEIIKLLNLYHFNLDNVLSKKEWICIEAMRLK